MLPRLSIIVCTLNRHDTLARCLASLRAQTLDPAHFEVVVVDNGCSNRTAAQVASYDGQPRFRYVPEPVEGLSHARNRGAREAQGAYLTYLDDDAAAPPDYLAGLAAVIDAHAPDIIGGPVFPYYTEKPPSWFRDEYEVRQYAAVSGFSTTCGVSGSNFTIRRETLEQVGGFDVRLGMKGSQQGFGEDRALLLEYRRRIPLAHQRVYYALECPVLHWVPPRKFRLSYMVRRQFDGGRMNVRVANVGATNAAAANEFARAPWATVRYVLKQWRRRGILGTDYVGLLLTASFHAGIFAALLADLPSRLGARRSAG